VGVLLGPLLLPLALLLRLLRLMLRLRLLLLRMLGPTLHRLAQLADVDQPILRAVAAGAAWTGGE
jgi:hypothetical protein